MDFPEKLWTFRLNTKKEEFEVIEINHVITDPCPYWYDYQDYQFYVLDSDINNLKEKVTSGYKKYFLTEEEAWKGIEYYLEGKCREFRAKLTLAIAAKEKYIEKLKNKKNRN